MTRSQAREQAFTLLFEKAFHPQAEMEDIIAAGLDNASIEQDDFTLQLASTAWDRLFDIDACIEQHARNWKIKRMSRVSLSVLRLAVCEILYFESIPISVSINEAVELCKKYAAQEDAAFVNGILGGIARAQESSDGE